MKTMNRDNFASRSSSQGFNNFSNNNAMKQKPNIYKRGVSSEGSKNKIDPQSIITQTPIRNSNGIYVLQRSFRSKRINYSS